MSEVPLYPVHRSRTALLGVLRVSVTPLPRIQSSQFLSLEPFSPEAGPSRTRSSHFPVHHSRTGLLRETAPPSDPTVGLFPGPYGGARGGVCFL